MYMCIKIRRAKIILLVGLLINAVLLVIYYCWQNQTGWLPTMKANFPLLQFKPLKRILYWNKYFDIPHFAFGIGREPFVKAECSDDRCISVTREMISDRDVKKFDAVIFHGYFFEGMPLDIQRYRTSRQRYILFFLEPPKVDQLHLQKVQHGFFNWTMTYRLDSDIPNLYGVFKTLTEPKQYLLKPRLKWKTLPSNFTTDDLPEKTKVIIGKKKKMVAWFVSHCMTPGKRESYVSELQKYVQVDIYGSCGSFVCPINKGNDCYRLLEENYKFYLSFENAICRDYVTEKFFNVMRYNVVPIVYGGANYSQIAPPGSYLDVRNFDSPQHLAEYLLYLDKHPEEYAKLFWWRSHYEVVHPGDVSFCRLCEMLHDEDLPPKSYDSIHDWYSKTICQSQEDYLKTDNISKTD